MQKLTYTTSEVADLLGMHPETVRRKVRNGELKAAGEQPYRISAAELRRWWREQGGGELNLVEVEKPAEGEPIENPVDTGSAVLDLKYSPFLAPVWRSGDEGKRQSIREDLAKAFREVAGHLQILAAIAERLDIDELPARYETEEDLRRFAELLEDGEIQ